MFDSFIPFGALCEGQKKVEFHKKRAATMPIIQAMTPFRRLLDLEFQAFGRFCASSHIYPWIWPAEPMFGKSP